MLCRPTFKPAMCSGRLKVDIRGFDSNMISDQHMFSVFLVLAHSGIVSDEAHLPLPCADSMTRRRIDQGGARFLGEVRLHTCRDLNRHMLTAAKLLLEGLMLFRVPAGIAGAHR